MRELRADEIQSVSGGFVPLAVLGGAAIAGVGSYLNGNSASVVLAASILGGLGGGATIAARGAAGLLSYMYRFQAGAMGVTSGLVNDSNASASAGVSDVSFVEEEDIAN